MIDDLQLREGLEFESRFDNLSQCSDLSGHPSADLPFYAGHNRIRIRNAKDRFESWGFALFAQLPGQFSILVLIFGHLVVDADDIWPFSKVDRLDCAFTHLTVV